MPRINRSEEKRKDILEAFGRCMANLPFDQIGMREIAAEAGVPTGSINYYFHGKKELLLKYYENLLSGYRIRVENWAHSMPENISSFSEFFQYFMQLFNQYANYENSRVHFGFLSYYQYIAQYPELKELSDTTCNDCARIVAESISKTKFRCSNPFKLAHFLLGGWDGYSMYCEVAVSNQNRWDLLSYLGEIISDVESESTTTD